MFANSAIVVFGALRVKVEQDKVASRYGGSTFALIFLKSWFICVTFHSIHLRANFSQVNVMIELIVAYIFDSQAIIFRTIIYN